MKSVILDILAWTIVSIVGMVILLILVSNIFALKDFIVGITFTAIVGGTSWALIRVLDKFS